MDRKFQIFVSSTYEDLKKEREQVVAAILKMGHIPIGMEMFNASDDEQWRIIEDHILQSDYYVVIVAHRYGSMTPQGVSYTEKEYNFALKNGIPILGFELDKNVNWPPHHVEKEAPKRRRLESFKKKIRGKPVEFWKDAADLGMRVAISLGNQITACPRPGWVRGDQVAGPESTSELQEQKFVITPPVLSRLRKVDSIVPGSLLDECVVFADNGLNSDTLVILVSGMGLDHRDFSPYIRAESRYRCIALTLFGYEPNATTETALSLKAHTFLLAEVINSITENAQFSRVLYVGFSAGCEIGFALLEQNVLHQRVNGFLALDANLSAETCFISSAIARVTVEGNRSNALEALEKLSCRKFGSLRQWLNVHRYLVNVFGKFSGSRFLVLQNLAAQIFAPFSTGTSDPFVRAYSATYRAVDVAHFVFSDNLEGAPIKQPLTSTQLNSGVHHDLLDVIKERLSHDTACPYRPESLRIQSRSDHFDLIEDLPHFRENVDRLLQCVREYQSGDHYPTSLDGKMLRAKMDVQEADRV